MTTPIFIIQNEARPGVVMTIKTFFHLQQKTLSLLNVADISDHPV